MEQFEHLCNTLGFPIAMTVWLFTSSAIAMIWTAKYLIIPLRDAFIVFLKSLGESIVSIDQKLGSLKTIDERARDLAITTSGQHREVLEAIRGNACRAK